MTEEEGDSRFVSPIESVPENESRDEKREEEKGKEEGSVVDDNEDEE